MSLNLSHIFIRYPDVQGVAQALQSYLTARLQTQPDLPRHVCASTGSPWIGIFAWGNSLSPDLAEHLSRALEAHAIWFGLAGRALAYRLRKISFGKTTQDLLQPSELSRQDADFPLPAYPDAEKELCEKLAAEGIPEPYLQVMAEEFGAQAQGTADAVLLATAPWSKTGLQLEPFAQRLPKRPPGLRTLFDHFDEEHSTVTDSVVLRGLFDKERARSLLLTLQRLLLRRAVPQGWTLRYHLESPQGKPLLEPIAALYAKERMPKRLAYELVVEQ